MKKNKFSNKEKIWPFTIAISILLIFLLITQMEGFLKGDSYSEIKIGKNKDDESSHKIVNQMNTFELIEDGTYERLNIFLSNFSETGLEKAGINSSTKELLFFAAGHIGLNYQDKSKFLGKDTLYINKHYKKDKLGEIVNEYFYLDIFNREDFYSKETSGVYLDEENKIDKGEKEKFDPSLYYFLGKGEDSYKSTFVLVDQAEELEDEMLEVEFTNYSNQARKYDPSPSTGIYKLLPTDAKKNFEVVGKGKATIKVNEEDDERYKLISYESTIQ